MKKIFFIITTIIIMMPILSFGQEIAITNENNEKQKKVSYAFINEFGNSFDNKGSIKCVSVFLNNICFNKTQDLIGIGTGFEIEWDGYFYSIPIYANYRHYFTSSTNLKPLINIAVGHRFNFIRDKYLPGLYSVVAAGFRVNAFSLTSGIFIKSVKEEFSFGVEIKTGFTLKK
jgi:hypothetical protein